MESPRPTPATSADTPQPGGGRAFAALYELLAGRLVGAARGLGCSAAEAEDIVHDLFVRLVRTGVVDGAVADPEAYAFASLRHAVWRRFRRRGLERTALERIGRERRLGDDPGHQRIGAAEPDAERLRAALALLPDAQREVVALRIDGGLSFAEIAQVTNVSLNTAAGRYRYALEKLRVALAAEVAR